MDKFAKQAFDEYNSATKTVRRAGNNGKPFWNINSSQFMYVPQFMMPAIPGAKEYIYTATDSKGGVYTFTAESPIEPLNKIWKDIAVGIVTLTVEAVNKNTGKKYLAGTRTFYKMEGFPGRDALPERACSYKECAIKAFRFVFNDPTTQYWLKKGYPDPDYYHNVYPAKMISSIVRTMIAYAELEPENAKDAMQLAINAADYLLSITYDESYALAGLPPTYSFKGLNKEIVDKNAPMAWGRRDQLMIIYPASAGSMFLLLEKATGDKKYFDAAARIADYYKANVLECGSWYLLLDAKSGEPVGPNVCVSGQILDFITAFYERTGEKCWNELADGFYRYIEKTCLENYNWEGQFEDIKLSGNYLDLTHLEADRMIQNITKKYPDVPEKIEEAKELMRFVEDQFVVWGEHAPWNEHFKEGDYWYSPAALEQYFWYVPIDGSTVAVMTTMLALYRVTGDELLLEKAKALGDSITRMQDPEIGVIPTHWMSKECTKTLENFWINCHIGSAFRMFELAKEVGEI